MVQISWWLATDTFWQFFVRIVYSTNQSNSSWREISQFCPCKPKRAFRKGGERQWNLYRWYFLFANWISIGSNWIELTLELQLVLVEVGYFDIDFLSIVYVPEKWYFALSNRVFFNIEWMFLLYQIVTSLLLIAIWVPICNLALFSELELM